MLKLLTIAGIMALMLLKGCAENEEQVLKDEKNYSPSEQTIWNPEQK